MPIENSRRHWKLEMHTLTKPFKIFHNLKGQKVTKSSHSTTFSRSTLAPARKQHFPIEETPT